MVAMKCGSTDYHFIRKDENGWYTKSGQNQGIYIPDSIVLAPVWYAMRPDEYGMLERLDYNENSAKSYTKRVQGFKNVMSKNIGHRV